MRRSESKFASPMGVETARRLGAAIRAARLARNQTQEAMAERARMSALTWLKIERGSVAVAMGSWLSALEQAGLLSLLERAANPVNDRVGEPLRQERARARARQSSADRAEYDF